MSIRRGERKAEDLNLECDQIQQVTEELLKSLPKETDIAPLNKWLVRIS